MIDTNNQFNFDQMKFSNLLLRKIDNLEWWSELNDFIVNSRNSKNIKIKEKTTRLLITKAGKIKIPITRFKIGEKTFFHPLMLQMIKEANKIQYEEAFNLFKYGISMNSISLKIYKKAFSPSCLIKKINKKILEEKKGTFVKVKKNVEYLYLEVDDAFGKIRDKKWSISKWKNRMIVIHAGKDEKGKIEKTILVESKAVNMKNYSISDLAEIINIEINRLFNFKKLILIGDGAKWMKHLAKLLNADFSLDSFHWKKRINDVLGYQKYKTQNKIIFQKYVPNFKKTIYKFVVELIESGKFSEALIFLENFVSLYVDEIKEVKIKEIKKLINYLKANQLGLVHFSKAWYIGSRTEAFVANWIKRKWKARNSTFSFSTFKFLLKEEENENLNYLFI